jgi:hypothetical protein
MGVGDFFFSPREKNTLVSTASAYTRRTGRVFVTRMVHARRINDEWGLCAPGDEGAVIGVGVWRIQ